MNIKNATSGQLRQIGDELLLRHKELYKSEEWIESKSIDGIKSWILHPSDGTISMVRAESVIQCNCQELFDFLITDIDKTCHQWNNVMYYSGSIKNYGDGFELSRIISEGNVVADREDVFLRYSGQLEDGSLFEVSKGYGEDVEPIAKHIAKYMVRSDMHFASKEVQAFE